MAHSNQNGIHLDYKNDNDASTTNSNTVSDLANLSDRIMTLTIDWRMSWYWGNPIAEQVSKQIWITVLAPNSSIVPGWTEFLNGGLGWNLWDKVVDALAYGIITTPATFMTFESSVYANVH